MNTKTKEGARNKGNPYFLRIPWNKGGLVNTGPDRPQEASGGRRQSSIGLGLRTD